MPAAVLRPMVSTTEFAMELRRCCLAIAVATSEPQMVVAVSGSAASVALCHLLRQVHPRARLAAVTVNDAAPGGGDHAHDFAAACDSISHIMHSLGIRHTTLTADWSDCGSGLVGDHTDRPLFGPVSNVPWTRDRARVRRYNMLARFCRQSRASVLVTARTCDDHIRRFLDGPVREPWRCAGHLAAPPHVHEGSVATATHHLRLIQPGLAFWKDRLVATCTEAGLDFLPDETNPLITHTDDLLRIKDCISTAVSTGYLPKELSTATMDDVGHYISQLSEAAEQTLQRVAVIMNKCVLRDPPSGTAFLNLPVTPETLADHWLCAEPHVASQVLHHVISWASPNTAAIDASAGERLRIRLVEQISTMRFVRTLVAESVILEPPRPERTGEANWIVARAPIPTKIFTPATDIVLRIGETTLWDGRFYVALSAPSSRTNSSSPSSSNSPALPLEGLIDADSLEFHVKQFELHDCHNILERLSALEADYYATHSGSKHRKNNVSEEESIDVQNIRRQRLIVKDYMARMPLPVRSTIPCVTLRVRGDQDFSCVIAVPTLGINLEPDLVDVKFSFRKEMETAIAMAQPIFFRISQTS